MLRVDHPGFFIIIPLLIERGLDDVLRVGVKNGANYLYTVINIPGHQVSGANKVLWISTIMKHVDARVLQVPINNTDRFDVFGNPLHARDY